MVVHPVLLPAQRHHARQRHSDEEYLHEDQRHLWRGESMLRLAIKRSVANLTTETIMKTQVERVFQDLEGESNDE